MLPHATSSFACSLLARTTQPVPETMIAALQAMPDHWLQAERLYRAVVDHADTDRPWQAKNAARVLETRDALRQIYSPESAFAAIVLAPNMAVSGARLTALAHAAGWRCLHLLDPFGHTRDWTTTGDAVSYLLCADGSAMACINGQPQILGQEDTPAFDTENAGFDEVLGELEHAPRWIVLDPTAPPEGPLDTAERAWDIDPEEGHPIEDLLTDIATAYYDNDDPPFDPSGADAPAWDNTRELRIVEHATPLFVALAQNVDATVSFTVVAADPDGDHLGHIYEDESDGEHIDVDLFLEALPLVAPIAEVTGAAWVYNDGAVDRMSGYCASSEHYAYTLDKDRLPISAHQFLAYKTAFRARVVEDPAFDGLRDRLLAAIDGTTAPSAHAAHTDVDETVDA